MIQVGAFTGPVTQMQKGPNKTSSSASSVRRCFGAGTRRAGQGDAKDHGAAGLGRQHHREARARGARARGAHCESIARVGPLRISGDQTKKGPLGS